MCRLALLLALFSAVSTLAYSVQERSRPRSPIDHSQQCERPKWERYDEREDDGPRVSGLGSVREELLRELLLEKMQAKQREYSRLREGQSEGSSRPLDQSKSKPKRIMRLQVGKAPSASTSRHDVLSKVIASHLGDLEGKLNLKFGLNTEEDDEGYDTHAHNFNSNTNINHNTNAVNVVREQPRPIRPRKKENTHAVDAVRVQPRPVKSSKKEKRTRKPKVVTAPPPAHKLPSILLSVYGGGHVESVTNRDVLASHDDADDGILAVEVRNTDKDARESPSLEINANTDPNSSDLLDPAQDPLIANDTEAFLLPDTEAEYVEATSETIDIIPTADVEDGYTESLPADADDGKKSEEGREASKDDGLDRAQDEETHSTPLIVVDEPPSLSELESEDGAAVEELQVDQVTVDDQEPTTPDTNIENDEIDATADPNDGVAADDKSGNNAEAEDEEESQKQKLPSQSSNDSANVNDSEEKLKVVKQPKGSRSYGELSSKDIASIIGSHKRPNSHHHPKDGKHKKPRRHQKPHININVNKNIQATKPDLRIFKGEVSGSPRVLKYRGEVPQPNVARRSRIRVRVGDSTIPVDGKKPHRNGNVNINMNRQVNTNHGTKVRAVKTTNVARSEDANGPSNRRSFNRNININHNINRSSHRHNLRHDDQGKSKLREREIVSILKEITQLRKQLAKKEAKPESAPGVKISAKTN